MKNKHIFIFAGEASGDLHGGEIGSSLKKLHPSLMIEGVCGPFMRKNKINEFLSCEEFQVMGFTDVLKTIPKMIKNFYKILNYLLKTKPDIILLIDYQEFNLLLSSKLRKNGFQGKIVQYVSPSIWAWRAQRTQTIEKNYNLLLTIYPFEKQYYSKTSLKVEYIGNPVYEKILKHAYDFTWKDKCYLPNKSIISIFPGSRKKEILNNLPLQINAAEEIEEDYLFCISYYSDKNKKIIEDYLQKNKKKHCYHLIPSIFNYELMKESTLAIAKSGTITLELAFHKIPTIVTYKISSVHKFICKNIFKINLPFYCIVNILANKKVFPEFIDSKIDFKNVSYEIIKLLKCENTRRNIFLECETIEKDFMIENSSLQAAQAILEI